MLLRFIGLSFVSLTLCTLFQHVPKRGHNELTDLMNEVLNDPLFKISLKKKNAVKPFYKKNNTKLSLKTNYKNNDKKIEFKPLIYEIKYLNVSNPKTYYKNTKPKRSEILHILKRGNQPNVKENGTLIVINFDDQTSDQTDRKRSEIQSAVPDDNLGYTIVLNNNGNDDSDIKKEKIFDELKDHFSEMEEQFKDLVDQSDDLNIKGEVSSKKNEVEQAGRERDDVPSDPETDNIKMTSDLKPKFVPFGKLTGQTKDSQLEADIDKLKHVKENLKLLNEDENESFNETLKQQKSNELKNSAHLDKSDEKSLTEGNHSFKSSESEKSSESIKSSEPQKNSESEKSSQSEKSTESENAKNVRFTSSQNIESLELQTIDNNKENNYEVAKDGFNHSNINIKLSNSSKGGESGDKFFKAEYRSGDTIKTDTPDYPVKTSENQINKTSLDSSKNFAENKTLQIKHPNDFEEDKRFEKISNNMESSNKEESENNKIEAKEETTVRNKNDSSIEVTNDNPNKNIEEIRQLHERIKLKLISINRDFKNEVEVQNIAINNKNKTEQEQNEMNTKTDDTEEGLKNHFTKKLQDKAYDGTSDDVYNTKRLNKDEKHEDEIETIQTKQNDIETPKKSLFLNIEQNDKNMQEKNQKLSLEEGHTIENNQRHEISWMSPSSVKSDNSASLQFSRSKNNFQKPTFSSARRATIAPPANPSPEATKFKYLVKSKPTQTQTTLPTQSSIAHFVSTQKQIKTTPTRKISAVKRIISNPVTKHPIKIPEPKVLDRRKAEAIIEFLNKDPLESWRYHFHTLKSLDLNSSILRSGLVNAGSIDRLKGVMRRALEGKDITLSIIGGSISAGGGLYKDRGNIDGLFYKGLVDWWNKMITPLTGSDMIVNNIAIGSIGTDYFSYCVKNHIATETDIVLWELAANDFNRYKMQPTKGARPLERLTRIVLELQNKPALLYVNFFKGVDFKASRDSCPNFEDQGEDIIAHYYKIPSLSWRAMVCGALVRNEPGYSIETLFSLDQYHPSLRGHAQMSLLLLLHLRHVMRAVLQWAIEHNGYIERFEDKYVLPEPLFMGLKTPEPLCWTLITADLNEKVTNNLKVKIVKENGFKLEYATNFPIRFDKVICWKAERPGALLAIQFYIPEKYSANGSKRFRSEVAVTTHTRWGGSSTIWVDNMTDRQIVIKEGRPNDPGKRTQVDNIISDLGPGTHTLNVLSHEGAFCLAAIMIDSS